MTKIKSAAEAFKETIYDIDKFGSETNPRGQRCRGIYFKMMEINPLYSIPDFKEKPFTYKYLAGEFAWYFKKERSLDIIQNFSTFWSKITNDDKTINSNYGYLLLGKQLRWVYDSLVKDKDTRQAIAFLNQPKFQYKGNLDFVCSMYLNFFIRNNKLNMKLSIRSNDIVYGFCYDVPWFSFILQYMFLWLKETKYPDLELGSYYHFADNIHYYERHFELIDKINYTSNEPQQHLFKLEKLPFLIDENCNYSLTEVGNKFCEKVIQLGQNKIKEYEPYIHQLKKLFKIEYK